MKTFVDKKLLMWQQSISNFFGVGDTGSIFLKESCDMLIEGREVLKWSYVFAFHVDE